jgi:hypothetical protein
MQLEQSTQSRSFGVLIGSRDPEDVKKEKIDKLNAMIEDVRYILMFNTRFLVNAGFIFKLDGLIRT